MSDPCCNACGNELEIGSLKCGGCGEQCDPDAARGFKIERRITRGNTLVICLSAKNPFTGIAPNSASSGFKARITVRENLGDRVCAFVGSFDLGDIIDQGGGRYLVTVPSETTYALQDGVVKLYYDVQFVENGQTWTQEKGLIKVMPGVAAYFDPQVVVRKTTHAEYDRKVVEVQATGTSDVPLFAWAGTLDDGQGIKIEAYIFAVRNDGGDADAWNVISAYRKSGGIVTLVNTIVTHLGATAWVVTPDPGSPSIAVHTAPAVNATFAARVETTFLKGA